MQNRKNLILAAIVLILVINAVIVIALSGKELKPESNQTGTIVSKVDPEVSDSQSTDVDQLSWRGWQMAKISGDKTNIYADVQLTNPLDAVLTDGSGVIVCERSGESCRIRSGTTLGWVMAESLEVSGEPVIYKESAKQSELTDIGDTDIGKELDTVAQQHGCVGVQIAIIKGGQITHRYEYGYQDKSSNIPVAADTKIRVASVSKVIVGMGVMSMQDMGILSIDEDLSKYWGADIKNPNFPDDPITFRNVFTHTSSLDNFGYSKRATSVLEENLGKGSSYMKIKPGDINAYKYNNSAMCTAGAVAGRAANINFDQYIREYFFAPLGIDASFHASNIKDTDKLSVVYNDGVPTIRVADFLNYKFYGGVGDDYSFYSGGMLISACDLAKMACILLNGGQYEQMYYLKQESIDQMLATYYELEDYDQCLVLRHRNNMFEGRSLYYHNGNMAGVYSLMCLDPATGDGMVIISNGSKEPEFQDAVYSVCGDLGKVAARLWKE